MMVVAIGMVGLALTLLTIVLGYIWRANNRLAKQLQEGQERLQEGQERLQEGQERLQKGMEGIASIVKDVHEGQKEMAKLLVEVYKKVSQ
ncbi:MAG: hypothetical protein ACE5J0_03335 [Candidatus Paceibacterales bacterium]